MDSDGSIDNHVGWCVLQRVYGNGFVGNERLCDYPKHTLRQIKPSDYLSVREKDLQMYARDVYEERLKFGIAREQARKDLPLSTYTEAYWKCDLRNVLHFLGLRMDSHAQQEIREYATIIGEQIIKPLFPLTWEAFVDYRLESMQLSRLDVLAIRRFVQDGRTAARAEYLTDIIPNSRERDECVEKLVRLGFVR